MLVFVILYHAPIWHHAPTRVMSFNMPQWCWLKICFLHFLGVTCTHVGTTTYYFLFPSVFSPFPSPISFVLVSGTICPLSLTVCWLTLHLHLVCCSVLCLCSVNTVFTSVTYTHSLHKSQGYNSKKGHWVSTPLSEPTLRNRTSSSTQKPCFPLRCSPRVTPYWLLCGQNKVLLPVVQLCIGGKISTFSFFSGFG